METLKNRRIKSLLRIGNTLETKHLIVVYVHNNLGKPQVAFVVSKRFSKKAVERNRAKRLLREALRLYGSPLKSLSYDIAIIPKKKVLNIKAWQLRSDINLLIETLKNAEKNSR